MKYIVTINNKSYEIEVEKGQASIIKTTETIVQNTPATPQAPVLSTGSSHYCDRRRG